MFSVNNIVDPEVKLKTIIQVTVEPEKKNNDSVLISEWQAYELVKWEASKTYLTHHVTRDNKNRLFKPYKDLARRIASVIKSVIHGTLMPTHWPVPCLKWHMHRNFLENLPALSDAKKWKLICLGPFWSISYLVP